jgi:hypothetical protein
MRPAARRLMPPCRGRQSAPVARGSVAIFLSSANWSWALARVIAVEDAAIAEGYA